MSSNNLENNATVFVTPEDRFFINLNDFLELIISLLERKKININPVIFILAKTYIEKIEKKNVINVFLDGSIENDSCIWESIAKENKKHCINYFMKYVDNLTKLNVRKLIDDRDPETLFNQVFSEEENIRIFWSYMKSFVRIALNYIKTNQERIPEKAKNFFTKERLNNYQEIFKKGN